jgi:hypothetical protein
MKIASAALQMESSHSKQQKHEVTESLRRWTGDRRPDLEERLRQAAVAAAPIQISDAGKAAQSSEASAIQNGIDAVENDPMLRLIRAMVAMMTGEDVKVFNTSELQGNSAAPAVQAPSQSAQPQARQQAQPVGFGVEYDRHESYSESEQTRFAAAGMVHTADGQEINFSVSLSMSRSYHEESDVSIRIGDTRQTQDPLILNFGGSAAQLTSQRFKFDINSDGKSENINFVTGGSGFLALDRNGDGQINNGSELFGAKSGDGFAELAALDSDKNGWIDENDAAYAQLRVWTKNGAGQDQLSTLKQANVGALSLASTATPFDLKEGNNALQGRIRASGLFLQENGKAGTLQQIDLTI